MRRMAYAAGLALLIGATGCSDFLTAAKAVRDPNQPTLATRDQLLAGVEAQVMDQQEGGVAMTVCEWMQQCAGVAGRFVDEFYHYKVNGSSFDANFNSLYTAGGLVSLRAIESSAAADNDQAYAGVAEVLEALQVAWAADIWGDIPYSDAVNPATSTPKFDAQMSIYAALQTLLDKAIVDLAGTGAGPGAADIFYNGDKAKWTQLAYTVKARLYLHTVEKLGNGEYAKALAAAQKGISAPGNDFKSVHSTNTSERNLWAQFQLTSFGNDLVAGARLVDMMKADNDPRLAEYYGKNVQGGYGGQDPAGANSPDVVSPIVGSGRTNNTVFPQPLVTWAENQLIIAESNFQTTGAVAAQPYLDAVRSSLGKASIPATLQSIMEEKYMLLYQNVEAWNDFKRACYPRLIPVNTAFSAVPGRFFYGTTEAQTNPKNMPEEGALATSRNANDPAPCPTT